MNLSDAAVQKDGIVSKVILKNKGGNVTLFTFDAGQELSEHTAPFDALVHVAEGKMEITIGGKPQTLQTGDLVIMPANIPHALKAAEPTRMILTMIRSETT